MQPSTLLPDVAEVVLESIRSDRSTITLLVRAARFQAACPLCRQPSTRIHSHYERNLADLPWNGIPVRMRLHTRRFFCATPGCGQRIFTERLPNTLVPYPDPLRRVSYFDEETNKRLTFLTNNFTLPAFVVAQIYKCRWQVELFFESSTWCTPLDAM